MSVIKYIEEQLSQRHRSRSEIIKSAVNDRLNKSLRTYGDELDLNVEHITQKSELNVLKKL